LNIPKFFLRLENNPVSRVFITIPNPTTDLTITQPKPLRELRTLGKKTNVHIAAQPIIQ